MKNLVLCIALAATVSPALAQEKLTKSDVSGHTYTFEIVDGSLIGRGADVLKQKIAQSQFVMLDAG